MTDNDEWLCSEYASSICDSWREAELRRSSYDCKSPQMKWRPNFINFLLNLNQYYALSDNTLHLAIYIFDIFTDNHIIQLWRLHLVAYTSIRIAAKLEDVYVPKIQSINSIFNSYPTEDYLILEVIMLSFFSWDVNVPTASMFLSYYIEFIVNVDDFEGSIGKYANIGIMTNALKSHAANLIEVSLFSCELLYNVLPSKLAAICIAGARSLESIKPIWPLRFVELTAYGIEDIKHELDILLNIEIASVEQLNAELAQMPRDFGELF